MRRFLLEVSEPDSYFLKPVENSVCGKTLSTKWGESCMNDDRLFSNGKAETPDRNEHVSLISLNAQEVE